MTLPTEKPTLLSISKAGFRMICSDCSADQIPINVWAPHCHNILQYTPTEGTVKQHKSKEKGSKGQPHFIEPAHICKSAWSISKRVPQMIVKYTVNRLH